MAQLPAELWVHVFRYLPTEDKLNIRVCCKYFKKLIDHGSLWKDSTVVLSLKNGSYNSEFWTTLCRRKIASVVVQSTKAKHWKQLALALPALTTVVMDQASQECLEYLKQFSHLKCLVIRGKTLMSMNGSMLSHPQELTHLSLCHVEFLRWTKNAFTGFTSQFTNLTSLVYHQEGNQCDPAQLFKAIITSMPKLKHLSLGFSRQHYVLSSTNSGLWSLEEMCRQSGNLSSLELVDYADLLLPEDLMRYLPCLQRLAVFYKPPSHDEVHDVSHLRSWLNDLLQLSSLVIIRGPHPHQYAKSIPATVTSLALCVGRMSSTDMATIAAQLPNLSHLKLDLWPSFSRVNIGLIPQLFPHLSCLKLYHQHVEERDFLSLQHLENLKRLEILGVHCGSKYFFSQLMQKFKVVTNDRIQIITSTVRDPLACLCTRLY